MRRYLILSVLGVCLLGLAPGATASAGSSTRYAGKNSQGQTLLFAVDHTARGPKFEPIFINQIDRCPVTGDVVGVEYLFRGFQIPISHGKFNFVLTDLFDRLRWKGTVTSEAASGTESIDLPAYDREGGLQDCAAGSLSWQAHALVPGSSTAPTPSTAYVVKIAKASDGSVRYSIIH